MSARSELKNKSRRKRPIRRDKMNRDRLEWRNRRNGKITC
jgi:hypothetical protein